MEQYLLLGRITLMASMAFGVSLWFAAAHRIEKQLSAATIISYSFPSQRLSLHQPVILTLKVKNDFPQPIQLDLGQDRKGGFAFSVLRPDGTKIQLPQFSREGISRSGTLSLQPGESYSQDLLLDEWHDFRIPGKYKVEGRLVNPIFVGDGARVERDQGFHAVIEIAPRNELALAKTCNTLADQVDDSNSYEDAAQATLVLSYIKDPIAVPYLRRALLAHKLVESIAIAGLEKIADEAAVRVLFEILKTESGDSAVLSRAALERIRKQSLDPNLRQEIEQNLKPTSPGKNLRGWLLLHALRSV